MISRDDSPNIIPFPKDEPPIYGLRLIELFQQGHIDKACSAYLALCEENFEELLDRTIHDTLLLMLAQIPTPKNIGWLMHLYNKVVALNPDATDISTHHAVINMAIENNNDALEICVKDAMATRRTELYRYTTMEKKYPNHASSSPKKSPTSRFKHFLLTRVANQPEQETKQDQIVKYIKDIERMLDNNKKVVIDNSDPLTMHAFVTIIEDIRQAKNKEQDDEFLQRKFDLAMALRPRNYPHDEIYRLTLESAVRCNNLLFAWELLQNSVDQGLIFIKDPLFLSSFIKLLSSQKAPWHIGAIYFSILELLNADEERIATLEYQNFQAFKELHHTALREMAKFKETHARVHAIYQGLTTYRNGKFADEKTFAIAIAAHCYCGDMEKAIAVLCNAEEMLTPRLLSLLHRELRQPEYDYVRRAIDDMYQRMPQLQASFHPEEPDTTQMQNYSLSGMILAQMHMSSGRDLPLLPTIPAGENDEIAQPAPCSPQPVLPRYASSHAVIFQSASQSPQLEWRSDNNHGKSPLPPRRGIC